MQKNDSHLSSAVRRGTSNSGALKQTRLFQKPKAAAAVTASADDQIDSVSSPESPKKKRRHPSPASPREEEERAVSDVDASCEEKVPSPAQTESDSDSSSVIVIGSLQRLKEATGKREEKQTFRSLLTESSKRTEPKQLLPDGIQLPVSVARRDGSSIADTRVPTSRSAPWVSVKEMCLEMNLNGKFTGVDIGRVNMGIVQLSCLGDKMAIENWMLVNLDTLCAQREALNPTEQFKTRDYSDEDRAHALYEWIVSQAKNNGIFDSDAVVIERQSFTREMTSLQSVVHMAVIASKKPIVVRKNDPNLDTLRTANCVSPAVIVSANSVKTCFSAFYPRVTETAASAAARQPWKKQKTFGVADANRGFGGDSEGKQYAQNKKNSVLYGQKLVTIDRIISTLGPKMSAEQKARFKAAKKDDIYDALWLVLFAIESWLPALYKRRMRGYGAKCTMYGALPQRRFRTCDALFEFAAAIGTPQEQVDELKEVLRVYRAGPGAAEEEGVGDED